MAAFCLVKPQIVTQHESAKLKLERLNVESEVEGGKKYRFVRLKSTVPPQMTSLKLLNHAFLFLPTKGIVAQRHLKEKLC